MSDINVVSGQGRLTNPPKLLPPGEQMGVESLDFVGVVAGRSDPAILVRELVKNAIEAKATRIRVIVNEKDGSLEVWDDGIGMSEGEMPRLLGNLGASTKQIGPYHNMGVGAKIMAAALSVEMTHTSWQGTSIQQVTMGPCEGGKYGLRYLADNSTVRTLRSNPYDASSESGTVVEISNFLDRFRSPTRELTLYLNMKFFEKIAVEITVESGGKEQRIRSLNENLQSHSQDYGRIDIGECTVHWYILKETAKEDSMFRPDSMSLIWNGESILSYPLNRGGAAMLNSWGIGVAQSNIVLCVEARGEDLGPSLERGDVKGWKEKEPLIREQFMANMPDELIRYMREFEVAHFDEKMESALVEQILTTCNAASILLQSGMEPANPQTPKDPRERSGTKKPNGERGPRFKSGIQDESSLTEEETGRRRRKHVSGLPGYRFGDSKALAGKPCEYNPRTNEIRINRDYEPIAKVLNEARGERDLRSRRALIAAQVIGAFAGLVAETSSPPDDDQLAAVLAFPIVARLGHLPPKSKK